MDSEWRAEIVWVALGRVGEVVPKQIELFYYSFNQYPIDFLSSYFNGFFSTLLLLFIFYNSSNPISIQSWNEAAEDEMRQTSQSQGIRVRVYCIIWDEVYYTSYVLRCCIPFGKCSVLSDDAEDDEVHMRISLPSQNHNAMQWQIEIEPFLDSCRGFGIYKDWCIVVSLCVTGERDTDFEWDDIVCPIDNREKVAFLDFEWIQLIELPPDWISEWVGVNLIHFVCMTSWPQQHPHTIFYIHASVIHFFYLQLVLGIDVNINFRWYYLYSYYSLDIYIFLFQPYPQPQ